MAPSSLLFDKVYEVRKDRQSSAPVDAKEALSQISLTKSSFIHECMNCGVQLCPVKAQNSETYAYFRHVKSITPCNLRTSKKAYNLNSSNHINTLIQKLIVSEVLLKMCSLSLNNKFIDMKSSPITRQGEINSYIARMENYFESTNLLVWLDNYWDLTNKIIQDNYQILSTTSNLFALYSEIVKTISENGKNKKWILCKILVQSIESKDPLIKKLGREISKGNKETVDYFLRDPNKFKRNPRHTAELLKNKHIG